MQFMYLWPLFLLILIPIVIIMYLMKQKAAPHPIPSLFLWKEMYENRESDTPWEKLKKSRLLIAQLITILALIFALLSPYIAVQKEAAEEVFIIIDNSGSMNTLMNNGKTRLENAKSQAASYVSTLPNTTEVTVISCSNQASNIISKAVDRIRVRSAIYSVAPTELKGDGLKSALVMCEGLIRASTGTCSVISFTDGRIPSDKFSGTVYSFNEKAENVSVNYIASSKNNADGTIRVSVNIQNLGENTFTSELNLYGDDELIAVSSFTVPAGDNVSVDFNSIYCDYTILRAEINQKDALSSDNTAYCLTGNANSTKVLLVTEQNIYLEKAIGLNDGIDLIKTNETDTIASGSEYDLYVFDGMRPDTLPDKGNMLFINCPAEEYFNLNNAPENSIVSIADTEFLSLVAGKSFGASECFIFDMPAWAAPVLRLNDESKSCAGFLGDYSGRKIGALGFDLHKTDFALKMEYPVFMYSLINRMSSTSRLSDNNIKCGESLRIAAADGISKTTVRLPDGTNEYFTDSLFKFGNTYQPGVYRINPGTEYEDRFVVNYDVSESFGTLYESGIANEGGNKTLLIDATKTAVKNYRNIAVIIALCLLTVEWIIYIKE